MLGSWRGLQAGEDTVGAVFCKSGERRYQNGGGLVLQGPGSTAVTSPASHLTSQLTPFAFP